MPTNSKSPAAQTGKGYRKAWALVFYSGKRQVSNPCIVGSLASARGLRDSDETVVQIEYRVVKQDLNTPRPTRRTR